MSCRKPWYDWLFILVFLLFGLVAWFYEPAFMLGCGWDGLGQGLEGPCGESWVGRAWLGYLAVEPIYADAPTYIQLANEFDPIFFGPFYALSLFAFLSNRHTQPWYRAVATFFCGMMVFALAMYLTWEVVTYRSMAGHPDRVDLPQVFWLNGPWLVLPVLLLIRLYAGRPVTRSPA